MFVAVVGLAVVLLLLRASGWEVWAFTAAAAILPIPYFVWARRRRIAA
jgi:hypothetical protein